MHDIYSIILYLFIFSYSAERLDERAQSYTEMVKRTAHVFVRSSFKLEPVFRDCVVEIHDPSNVFSLSVCTVHDRTNTAKPCDYDSVELFGTEPKRVYCHVQFFDHVRIADQPVVCVQAH